ncbi:unnamed protein product [Linum tenue]|jgi:hypothetical protein
MSIG